MYPDADAMGFIHHARYPVYLEAARIEMIRHGGDPYRDWEARGLHLPLTHLAIEYQSPGRNDDWLEVHAWVTELTRLRVGLAYRVECPERRLTLVRATTRHAFMNGEGRPVRVGPDILAQLEPYLVSGG